MAPAGATKLFPCALPPGGEALENQRRHERVARSGVPIVGNNVEEGAQGIQRELLDRVAAGERPSRSRCKVNTMVSRLQLFKRNPR